MVEIFSTFSSMKTIKRTSIKVDENSIKAVKKHIKKTKSTIGEFYELGVTRLINPMYVVHDNCDEFRKFLDRKGVQYTGADHSTIILGNVDIYRIGFEFGIFAAKNNPALK